MTENDYDSILQSMYKGVLGRQPSKGEVSHWMPHIVASNGLENMFDTLANSSEARLNRHKKNSDEAFFQYLCEFDAIGKIRDHEKKDRTASPDYVTNFLGTRVPPEVFPPALMEHKGTVEPLPIPANWHADIAEWAAALKSVDEAKKEYRIIELGCGWGCWLSNMGMAARNAGLKVDLIGIEGDSGHLKFAEKTMQINGFSPDDYNLVLGVASSDRQQALFPTIKDSGKNYGAEPIFNPSEKEILKKTQSGKYEVIQGHTLQDLCENKLVDLLHIDIQGSEVDFIIDNFNDIDKYVKRVLIGTHSREIDGKLMEFFRLKKYRLEVERPSLLALKKGEPYIRVDGVQLWSNPKIT